MVIACVGGWASPAKASPGLELGFADPLFQSTADRGAWLDQAVAERAGLVKLFVSWDGVVGSEPDRPNDPDDPAYSFGGIDESVRAAAGRGLSVLVGVQGAPNWAEGGGRPNSAPAGTWKPDPAALGSFMTALAKRYSGSHAGEDGTSLPRVDSFQVWNEPNLSTYLTPQWRGKRQVAAPHYTKMLNASYRAVHSVDKGNRIVTAGLAPYGDEPGGNRTRPLEFWRKAFCLKKRKLRAKKRCSRKARFDVFAHHAINTSGPPRQSALDSDDASSADLGAVRRTLRAAERGRTLAGKNKRRHPMWATELWWESDPPAKDGYSLRKQARFIQETLYLSWRAKFSAVIQLRIRDAVPSSSPGTPTGDGLFFLDGSPKPAAAAFRFPFVVSSTKGGRAKVWGKAPSSGRVKIERRKGGRWRPAGRLKASRNRIFAGRVRAGGAAELRAVSAGETSLGWRL